MNLFGFTRRAPRRSVEIAATLALFCVPATALAPTPPPPPPESTPSSVESRLAELERAIVAADYRAELDALGRLRDEAAALGDDPAHGYLARYWSGFASWRLAMNSANVGAGRDAIRDHLKAAAAEFEASLAARPDFADSLAASASVSGWLGNFVRDDTDRVLKATVLYYLRTRRALRLEPDNPRVLWVDASMDLYFPAAIGGDVKRAIATYRRMLEVATPGAAADPHPDWGAPEAHMSIAFASLRLDPPDIETARAEARAALELVPDWSYVRDVLVPQIEAAAAGAAAPGAP